MKQAIESIVALGGVVEFSGFIVKTPKVSVRICLGNSGISTTGRTVEEAFGAALEEITMGAHRRVNAAEIEAMKLDNITANYKQDDVKL